MFFFAKKIVPSTIFSALFIAAGLVSAKTSVNEGRLNEGAELYHNYCSVCHGDRGNGDSRALNSLNPAPKNFVQSPHLTKAVIATIVSEGKVGTAMVGWKTQLSPQQIDLVSDYVMYRFVRQATDSGLLNGRRLYESHCIGCHGPAGQGIPNPAIGMNTPPASLTTPDARKNWTTERLIEIVRHGRSGTYMTSFGDRLKKSEIANLVDYLETGIMLPMVRASGTHAHGRVVGSATAPSSPKALDTPFANQLKANLANGKRLYAQNCVPCHGSKGDGQGPRAYFINPRPASLLAEKYKGSLNRPALHAVVSAGKLGTEMPAWEKVLGAQEIADVSEYVFTQFVHPELGKKQK